MCNRNSLIFEKIDFGLSKQNDLRQTDRHTHTNGEIRLVEQQLARVKTDIKKTFAKTPLIKNSTKLINHSPQIVFGICDLYFIFRCCYYYYCRCFSFSWNFFVLFSFFIIRRLSFRRTRKCVCHVRYTQITSQRTFILRACGKYSTKYIFAGGTALEFCMCYVFVIHLTSVVIPACSTSIYIFMKNTSFFFFYFIATVHTLTQLNIYIHRYISIEILLKHQRTDDSVK